MEEGARSLARLGGQARRRAATSASCAGSPPICGPIAATSSAPSSALVLGLGRGAVPGRRPAPPDRRRLRRPARRRPGPRASRRSAIVIVALAVATFLRSYLVTWLGERVVADLRRDVYAPRPASLARLLRGHAHRRGPLAADHRHQRHPDRDRRQRHPGAAQRAAGRGRPGPAGGHQPPPDRAHPGRGAAGRGADRRDRPPRPAALARRAGPHGRRLGCGRGDHQRHPHRAVLRPGGSARAARFAAATEGAFAAAAALRPGARPAGCDRHHAGVRRDRGRALARRPRRAGRPDHRPASCPPSCSTPPWSPARSAASATCSATCSGPPAPPSACSSCWTRRPRSRRPRDADAAAGPQRRRASRFEDVSFAYPVASRPAGAGATSTSTSGRARPWPWSARPAPARPASSSC